MGEPRWRDENLGKKTEMMCTNVRRYALGRKSKDVAGRGPPPPPPSSAPTPIPAPPPPPPSSLSLPLPPPPPPPSLPSPSSPLFRNSFTNSTFDFFQKNLSEEEKSVRVHIGIDEDLRMILEMDPSIFDRTPPPVVLSNNHSANIATLPRAMRVTRPQGWY
ncbi:hypothetical protein HZH66_013000 [Vespula vulgaris]|uniref:Uncharacterized protein n=1 Tax=Vespula vulgaris TaxID=7454 RepID=A0A834J8Z0_VESVU|nr:hypothetical protein HZH66_013000 [Vespula vulgaris]